VKRRESRADPRAIAFDFYETLYKSFFYALTNSS